MKMGKWARLLLLVTPLAAGCGNFWQDPYTSSTSYTLSNSGNLSIAPGASSGNTATITVTPSSSFTGTVALTCAVTTSITSATSPATCSVSPTSVTISGTTAETATLTATTTSTTSAGAYELAVTGTSGTISESTTVCVEVSSNSSTCSASAGASGVFYVINQTTDQIVALNMTSAGKLNTIGSYALPSSLPGALAVAPNNKFLYVSTGVGIYLYTIGSNGALTLGNSGQPISSDPAYAMQVDATDGWLVAGISGLPTLHAIAINASTGQLASAGEQEQTFSLSASTVTGLAISPNDSSSCTDCYVFVSLGTGGFESVHFDPANADPFGGAGTTAPLHSLGGDNTVAVDPTNRLLYVGEADALPSAGQSGGLRVFTIGATSLTELSGSPFAVGGTGPSSILPSADGNYLYVANQSVSGSAYDNIISFSVSTSALASITTTAAGPTGRMQLAEDSNSVYLLAVDFAGDPDLQAYTMNAGTLTSALTSTTGSDPVGAVAIAAAP